MPFVENIHQRAPRIARIDHGAAEKIGRGARHRQQRRRDQATARGFRDRNGLFARDQLFGDLFGYRNEVLHIGAPRMSHQS
jgi:hypothetical protein